jgi:hypothetical protein
VSRKGMPRLVLVRYGPARKPPTRSAWTRLRCRKVGYAPASLGGARRSAVVFGELWKPPSCWHGGRSTRPWWDWLRPGWVRHARVVRCMSRLGFHHHRGGTLADQGGRGGVFAVPRCRPRLGVDRCGLRTTPVQARFPIDAGGVGSDCVSAAHVSSGRAVSRSGRTWNQARAGTGPDQRRRLGMRQGMVRRVEFGSGKSLPG